MLFPERKVWLCTVRTWLLRKPQEKLHSRNRFPYAKPISLKPNDKTDSYSEAIAILKLDVVYSYRCFTFRHVRQLEYRNITLKYEIFRLALWNLVRKFVSTFSLEPLQLKAGEGLRTYQVNIYLNLKITTYRSLKCSTEGHACATGQVKFGKFEGW